MNFAEIDKFILHRQRLKSRAALIQCFLVTLSGFVYFSTEESTGIEGKRMKSLGTHTIKQLYTLTIAKYTIQTPSVWILPKKKNTKFRFNGFSFRSELLCYVISLSISLSLCVCFCLATFLLALMSELLIFLILLNMFAFRCVGAVLTLLVCIRINCFLSLYWNGVGGSSSNVKNLDKHGFWLQCVTIK